jgi:hypothetical protein
LGKASCFEQEKADLSHTRAAYLARHERDPDPPEQDGDGQDAA